VKKKELVDTMLLYTWHERYFHKCTSE